MNIIDKTFSVRFKDIKFRESFRHSVHNFIKCSVNKAFNINTLMMEEFPDNTSVLPINMTLVITDNDINITDINLKENEIIEDDDLPL